MTGTDIKFYQFTVNKEKKEEKEWEMLRSAVQEKLNTAYKGTVHSSDHFMFNFSSLFLYSKKIAPLVTIYIKSFCSLKRFILSVDSNVGGKHVEWSKVRKGVISVSGFPAGLKAAPASSFGKENLLRILSDDVVISFTGKIL